MIVPQYWAESRVQHRKAGKQITVRRFGWSDTSQAEAGTHADQRAAEALRRLLSGEKLDRREPKIPYNGADGVPIREEILDRRGETVITRNSYGASCLNTPDVLFADIDFERRSSSSWQVAVVIIVLMIAVTGWSVQSFVLGIVLGMVALLVLEKITKPGQESADKDVRAACGKIRKFATRHPEWNLRVYRTPAGLRVLATHQTFSPNDPAVAECFKALGTDRIYRRMCLNQQCFRARVSPKPWRIGIGDHLRPRPGTWPVNPERLPLRNAWVARYEAAAKGYASCRLLESIGSGLVSAEVQPVQEWHDQLSGATSSLPIA